MNRRFNSPVFTSFNQNNSPITNCNLRNAGLRDSLSPDFIPFEYSSPLSSFKNNDNRNRRFNRGSIRSFDKSFNSPRSSGSSFNSPYNSSAFNQSGDFRKHNFQHRQRFNNNPNSIAYDSTKYFNDSMIVDPWEELEKKFKEEKEIIIVQTNVNKTKSVNDNESENDSSSDSAKIEDDDTDVLVTPDELSSSISGNTINTSNSDA